MLVSYLAWPRPGLPPDDTSGGIATSSLIARCQEAVQAKLQDANARFPAEAQTPAQFSSDSDGKRWNGWVICPTQSSVTRADFTCAYTPADDSLKVEIIKP